MHPIEQLRYVARTSSTDAVLLASESAHALASFGNEPGGLLLGTRQLLKRQPLVAPLWWVGSHMANALSLHDEAYRLSEALYNDRTGSHLAAELAPDATVLIAGDPAATVGGLCERPDVSVLVVDIEGQGFSAVRRLERAGVEAEAVDPAYLSGAVEAAAVVITEATAVGGGTAICELTALAASLLAGHSSTPQWMVVPEGRSLPGCYVQEMVVRSAPRRSAAWLAAFETMSTTRVDRWVTAAGASEHEPKPGCPELPELCR